MLKQRIITALVMLPIALAGFFYLQGGAFALFIGAVVVVAAWEWARLAGFSSPLGRLLYAVAVAALITLVYQVPALASVLLSVAVLWWALATVLVMTYPRSSAVWSRQAVKALIGALILLPAWQGLVLLKQWPQGNALIMAVMVLVWGADIGAYFAGKAFGRRKLAPAVSPGKSWEGLIGGLLASLLIALAAGVQQQWGADGLLLALFGAVVVVLMSVVGDLTESMFKRQAGIKDSSALLPGHGGFLDRIDSLTAAVPVFAALLWLSGWSAQ